MILSVQVWILASLMILSAQVWILASLIILSAQVWLLAAQAGSDLQHETFLMQCETGLEQVEGAA